MYRILLLLFIFCLNAHSTIRPKILPKDYADAHTVFSVEVTDVVVHKHKNSKAVTHHYKVKVLRHYKGDVQPNTLKFAVENSNSGICGDYACTYEKGKKYLLLYNKHSNSQLSLITSLKYELTEKKVQDFLSTL